MTRNPYFLQPRSGWLFLLLVAALSPYGFFPVAYSQDTPPPANWYKGNTHTHTLNSDGDSTPDEVVRWYRENGYHFLVLSDHNFLTRVEALNSLYGASERFIVIPGEEVTDRFGEKPLHVNGLNLNEYVAPRGGGSVVETLQNNINAIREIQGVPHINHPNFGWAITPEELKTVHNYRLFEIFNGHPRVNNLGGGGFPSLEEMWDILLSGGKRVYGIAVDDAHHFKRPWDPTASKPGRGWVMVRARSLDAVSILQAMEAGDFYATTGVLLDDCIVTSSALTVDVRENPSSRYRIQFIGNGGRLLRESFESPAVYEFQGDEGYVRTRVIESNGGTAWLQPVFVDNLR